MIQLKTSLNKVEITYIENTDFPLSIDGVHLHDSDINELYEFLKTQVYKDESIHSVRSSVFKEVLDEYKDCIESGGSMSDFSEWITDEANDS